MMGRAQWQHIAKAAPAAPAAQYNPIKEDEEGAAAAAAAASSLYWQEQAACAAAAAFFIWIFIRGAWLAMMYTSITITLRLTNSYYTTLNAHHRDDESNPMKIG